MTSNDGEPASETSSRLEVDSRQTRGQEPCRVLDWCCAAVTRNIELQKQLAKRRYVDPATIAYEYAALGDKDQTFQWLEKAYSEKARGLQTIKIAHSLDPFRSDPRYIDLLKRMGLPQ